MTVSHTEQGILQVFCSHVQGQAIFAVSVVDAFYERRHKTKLPLAGKQRLEIPVGGVPFLGYQNAD